jgi:PH (Pleckstrin Homology) domain-containing protein
MSATVGAESGAEHLGGWRLGARAELRALPRLLASDEKVLAMVLGSVGSLRGRLFVATDSRVLLVSKLPLRRVLCTAFPYERIQVSQAAPEPAGWKLDVLASGRPQTWHLFSAERAERFVRLLAERSQAQGLTTEPAGSALNGGTTDPAVGGACATTSGAGLRLVLNVAALAVVVLFFTCVLPRTPALIAFLGLALMLAVLEWRASTPALQIALGIATAVAVALFVFEVLPFGAGALLAAAAIAADIGFRRRGQG